MNFSWWGYTQSQSANILYGEVWDTLLDTKTMKDQEHIALHAELVRLCRARRNPLQQPFSPVGLMEALNPCLVKSRQYTFDTEEGWDAASFLLCLLGELHFLPGNLVETLEEGVCQICGNTSKQVFFNVKRRTILSSFCCSRSTAQPATTAICCL